MSLPHWLLDEPEHPPLPPSQWTPLRGDALREYEAALINVNGAASPERLDGGADSSAAHRSAESSLHARGAGGGLVSSGPTSNTESLRPKGWAGRL